MGVTVNKETVFLDLKLSQYSEHCILIFGWFPGVLFVFADFSAHSVCSIFIDSVSRKKEQTNCSEMSANKIQRIAQRKSTMRQCVFWLCVQQSCWAIKGPEAERITGAC